MINPPRTGMAFSAQGLRQFKQETQATLIITVIEFEKLKPAEQSMGQALIQEADKLIFLDEYDRTAAAQYDAAIIPVLPTIPCLTADFDTRGNDIISFGMIRVGKGLGLILELAKQIKIQNIPDKKIWVVGTVQDNKSGKRELSRLMTEIYPEKMIEISETQNTAALKRLLVQYQQSALIPALPLEIRVDVPTAALPELFNRCKYAFLPAYRGATLRNSSMSSALAQNFITYSHIEGITPKLLLADGEYQEAMILFPNFDGTNGTEYVEWVLHDILERDAHSERNCINLACIQRLTTEVLNRRVIAQQHQVIYDAVRHHARPPLIFSGSIEEEEKESAERKYGFQFSNT
jgi:hypothetical protein